MSATNFKFGFDGGPANALRTTTYLPKTSTSVLAHARSSVPPLDRSSVQQQIRSNFQTGKQSYEVHKMKSTASNIMFATSRNR